MEVVVPPAADGSGLTDPTSATTDEPAGRGNARSGRFRRALLGVLLLVTVVAGGLAGGRAIWLAAGEDEDLQPAREQVMSQARQFMLRVNTYGPDDLDAQEQMPDYREAVSELITPKFRTSFEEQVTVAEQSVAQVGLQREAEIFGVGVSGVDEDSATVLVAGAFTNSYEAQGGKDGERVEQAPALFRVEVSLVKIDGDWLVDDFAPVTQEGAP